jgi:hypothetical protein
LAEEETRGPRHADRALQRAALKTAKSWVGDALPRAVLLAALPALIRMLTAVCSAVSRPPPPPHHHALTLRLVDAWGGPHAMVVARPQVARNHKKDYEGEGDLKEATAHTFKSYVATRQWVKDLPDAAGGDVFLEQNLVKVHHGASPLWRRRALTSS